MSDYQQPSYSPAPQNHTMAIVSLIFGILGLVGICPGLGSVIAVATGMMARNDIRNNPGQYSGDGLAKVGQILGWIGIGLAVLAICFFIAWFGFIAAMIGAEGGFQGFRLLTLVRA